MPITAPTNLLLLVGAALSFIAALLHFACLFWGAEGFRVLGAGNDIVRLSQARHWYPPLIAFALGAVLTVWAAYALAAGGFITPLPFLRLVLVAITGIYLLRAVAFPFLKRFFPDNSTKFWLVSSGLCLLIGVVHLLGLMQVWERI
ncbi:MAG: hypothetical protein LBF16_11245 [Pseudomonadales bacterium]|jgi:hypothetical protein|nr:hypothetical protein [Pseudomonadales bacterium]